jgi:hypothetical protein
VSSALARKLAFIAIGAVLIGGCQYVGPIAIDQGRDRYNKIIQSTSKEQTLSNVIRVHNREPISYMDVSEVDATTTLSGAVSGGLASIGARAGTTGGTLAGQTGSVTGGVTYSESPLIRYTPLLGQSLVAQLVTPVSPDSIVFLFDSGWDIAPLIDFSTAYLTPDFAEFYAALNVIAELYYDGAVALVATKSDLNKEPDTTKTATGETKAPTHGVKNPGNEPKNQPLKVTLEVTSKPAGGGGANDTIVVYLNPFRFRGDLKVRRRELQLWSRLLLLYAGTQKNSPPEVPARCPKIDEVTLLNFSRGAPLADQRDLEFARKCLPNFIELRTMPVKTEQSQRAKLTSGAPLFRTYSGLGILKAATEEPIPRIAFVDAKTYDDIRHFPWNASAESFYTLDPRKEKIDKYYHHFDAKDVALIRRKLSEWLDNNASQPDRLFVYEQKSTDPSSEEYLKANRILGLLRRYILIVTSDHAPVNAYVAHLDNDVWYYIDAKDTVSQSNFNLIHLFMTMMAVPSTTPPIAPTINVGGG